MSKPGKEHWTSVKRVSDICVALLLMNCATKEDQDWTRVLDIQGFVDAYCVGDLDHRRSKVGMCLTYLEEKSVG
jgi:hypothetical protein